MPYAWMLGPLKKKHDTYCKMMLPVNNALPDLTPLTSGCNRPLQMTFEDHVTSHIKLTRYSYNRLMFCNKG